jgi:hypothetical protein
MHAQTWALHDAVFELARELGLRSYRVECKVGPEGETIIALVLSPSDGRTLASEGKEKRRS